MGECRRCQQLRWPKSAGHGLILDGLEADLASVLGADHQAEVRLIRGGKRQVLMKVAAQADLSWSMPPASCSRGRCSRTG